MSQHSLAGMPGLAECLLNGHTTVRTCQWNGQLRTNNAHVL